jgi:hypothetical protein
MKIGSKRSKLTKKPKNPTEKVSKAFRVRLLLFVSLLLFLGMLRSETWKIRGHDISGKILTGQLPEIAILCMFQGRETRGLIVDGDDDRIDPRLMGVK